MSVFVRIASCPKIPVWTDGVAARMESLLQEATSSNPASDNLPMQTSSNADSTHPSDDNLSHAPPAVHKAINVNASGVNTSRDRAEDLVNPKGLMSVSEDFKALSPDAMAAL